MTQVVASQVQRMFGSIAQRYDVTNTVLSFGIHHLWKRLVVRSLPLEDSSMILDLCTGTGDLLPLLRSKFRYVVGVDFCLPMLEVGQDRPGHEHLPLVQGDALQLPFRGAQFDGVTVAFGIRNLERLSDGLREIHRIIRVGGFLVVLEFGQPDGKLFGPLYRFYSKWILPHIGGALTGNRDAYGYLPETAGQFPCGERFRRILVEAGFAVESSRRLSLGIAYLYLARKR